MTPQTFEFIYSKAFYTNSGKLHNMQIGIKAMAYFRSSGEVRTVDIAELTYRGEKVPDNFLWGVNENLWNEIEEAAMEHAKDKFPVIDTTPVI